MVASLYISIRNLIIITTSEEMLETRNFFFKICKIGRYLGKTGYREVEAGVSLGGLEEMERIWQLTNLIANSQLLKPLIEPILTNVLISMIVVRFSWNF